MDNFQNSFGDEFNWDNEMEEFLDDVDMNQLLIDDSMSQKERDQYSPVWHIALRYTFPDKEVKCDACGASIEETVPTWRLSVHTPTDNYDEPIHGFARYICDNHMVGFSKSDKGELCLDICVAPERFTYDEQEITEE